MDAVRKKQGIDELGFSPGKFAHESYPQGGPLDIARQGFHFQHGAAGQEVQIARQVGNILQGQNQLLPPLMECVETGNHGGGAHLGVLSVGVYRMEKTIQKIGERSDFVSV